LGRRFPRLFVLFKKNDQQGAFFQNGFAPYLIWAKELSPWGRHSYLSAFLQREVQKRNRKQAEGESKKQKKRKRKKTLGFYLEQRPATL
jgi:hypothetical protein